MLQTLRQSSNSNESNFVKNLSYFSGLMCLLNHDQASLKNGKCHVKTKSELLQSSGDYLFCKGTTHTGLWVQSHDKY